MMQAKSVLLLLLLLPSTAYAFLCTRTPSFGPSVAWNERAIVLQRSGTAADVDDAAVNEALQRAIDVWTNVECSDMVLSLGPPTTERLAGFDWHAGSDDPSNQNIVVFRNNTPGDPVDEWLHTFGALAITTVTFESTTGRLLDADVEVNDVSFDFTACDPGDGDCVVDFDLQNTLAHELGHVVGLDHPPDVAEATMFASAAQGDLQKRDLSDDDIAAVCTLYPVGQTEPGECFGVGRPPLPTVRFERTLCASTGPDGVVVGAILLVLLWRTPRKPDDRRRIH